MPPSPKFNVVLNAQDDYILELPINFTATGDNLIIPGVSSQIIRVYRYFLMVRTATDLTFKDGASNLQTGPMPMAANEAMVFTFDTKPWFTLSLGNAFIINSSGGNQVSGRVYFTQS
jgi:hypothetical protein